MKITKDKTLIAISALLLAGLSIFAWCKKPEAYSDTERRSLAQFPKLETTSIVSGRFMDEFESYSMDQFPLRDSFRTLKAIALKYVFRQKDNHGIYSVNGIVSKLEYPLNENKVNRAISKMNEVQKAFMADCGCSTYLCIIPDKNYFLAEENGYPAMDYAEMVRMVKDGVSHDRYIDIFDLLDITDFYRTDQHWKQEKIQDVANRILSAINGEREEGTPADYQLESINTPFYGAYVGQSALSYEADTICYLNNDVLNQCVVTSYNTGAAKQAAMYDLNKAYGKDPYEMFLSGSDALLVIENPNAATEKELVVFRDSFGSSLIPLLVDGYAKITVIDLRYINSAMLGKFVEFKDQDVLFLYSTLILNNSISQ